MKRKQSPAQLANLRPIKKGQVLNPEGARAHNPDMVRLKRLTNAEVAEIGTLIVLGNEQALSDIILDSEIDPKCQHSALKVWMARIALNGIRRGDGHALDKFLDRVVGKVREKIEISGEDGGPIRNQIIQMTPAERLKELKRLRKKRKEAGHD